MSNETKRQLPLFAGGRETPTATPTNVSGACAYCGKVFPLTKDQRNSRSAHYCRPACARKARINPAKRATKACLECGAPVTRFVSQWKGRRPFCSRECMDRHGLVKIQCFWPGCQTVMPCRVTKVKGHTAYKIDLVKRGYYASFPICPTHRDRLKSIGGPKAKLNSFHKIVTRVEQGYGIRKVSGRMMRFVLFERAGGVCQSCKCELAFNAPPRMWQVDHIQPVFRGGATKIDNLRILCRRCHDEKSAGEKSAASLQRHVAHKNGRWLTHYEKDQLIETLRAEIAALRAENARFATERHEEPIP